MSEVPHVPVAKKSPDIKLTESVVVLAQGPQSRERYSLFQV